MEKVSLSRHTIQPYYIAHHVQHSIHLLLKVKVLYVRGLLPEVTEQMITERFEPYGSLERVRKVKDYAFIHFAEREQALQVFFSISVCSWKHV